MWRTPILGHGIQFLWLFWKDLHKLFYYSTLFQKLTQTKQEANEVYMRIETKPSPQKHRQSFWWKQNHFSIPRVLPIGRKIHKRLCGEWDFFPSFTIRSNWKKVTMMKWCSSIYFLSRLHLARHWICRNLGFNTGAWWVSGIEINTKSSLFFWGSWVP